MSNPFGDDFGGTGAAAQGGAHMSPRARSGLKASAADSGASPFSGAGGATDPFGAQEDDPTVILGNGGPPNGMGGAAAAQFNGPSSVPGPAPSTAVDGAALEKSREFQRMVARQPRRPDEVFLVTAAPLLTLIAQLRHMVDFADVSALRRRVVEEIDRFESRSASTQAVATEIMAARYILCAVLDETVLTKPWGNRSDWSVNSLLNQFHGETWGGEKVFQILDRARNEPSKYLSLLRLIDVCLALGFEGRYRVLEGGRDQLETLRRDVGRIISDQIGRPPAELSANWQGRRISKRLRNYIPIWVIFLITGVLLFAGYLGVQYWTGLSIDPLINQINRIAR